MKLKNLFVLSLKTFIIDLIIFIIGFLLFFGFATLCKAEVGTSCSQPLLFYLGFILILISILHFLVSVIALIIKKLIKR